MTEKKLRPPYPSSGIAENVLSIFRRLNPPKIDAKFIVENKIATAPNAFTATDFSKWMGITDLNENVNENIANKLRMVGENREEAIREMILNSYRDLTEKVNLEEAKKDDITNYFISNHRMGTTSAKYAASLFLYLCNKYSIPISEELKKSLNGRGRPKGSKQKGGIRKIPKEREKSPDSPKKPEEDLGENKYIISIHGNNTNFRFPVNNQEDIIDVEAIIGIIKRKLS